MEHEYYKSDLLEIILKLETEYLVITKNHGEDHDLCPRHFLIIEIADDKVFWSGRFDIDDKKIEWFALSQSLKNFYKSGLKIKELKKFCDKFVRLQVFT